MSDAELIAQRDAVRRALVRSIMLERRCNGGPFASTWCGKAATFVADDGSRACEGETGMQWYVCADHIHTGEFVASLEDFLMAVEFDTPPPTYTRAAGASSGEKEKGP